MADVDDPQIHSFLALVDAYKDVRHISDSRVSTLVFNDGKKVTMLRKGRDIGVMTLRKAVQWFSDNWPEGAIWPQTISRPRPVQFADTLREERRASGR